VLRNPAVCGPIVGATKPHRLPEAVAAVELKPGTSARRRTFRPRRRRQRAREHRRRSPRGRPPRERGVFLRHVPGGSISAEHGISALKAPWLALARTDAERLLFARIRAALDPTATLNPNVLPR